MQKTAIQIDWSVTVEQGDGIYYPNERDDHFTNGVEALKNAFEFAVNVPYDGDNIKERIVVLRNDKLFWRECDE